MRTEHPYHGRTAALGTRHGKLGQVGLPLLGMVGLQVQAVEVDSDSLGTFTGEVPRLLGMRDAAIAKARMAIAATGCPLALASEGTIGPDPQVPLLVSDRELVVLVDDEAGVIISESVRAFDVRAVSTLLRPGDDVAAFLDRAGFPRHRLIVRPEGIEPAQVADGYLHKGIGSLPSLRKAIDACASQSPVGQARVESDLRAHCSPSRQAVITWAAWALGSRLARCCPACAAPGWGPVDLLRGLPCEWCGTWVESAVRGQVLACARCEHSSQQPDGRTAQDPAQCPACNP